MITGKVKSQVDQIWDAFWTGGISNPLSVIEQISYLLFIRRLDDLQITKEQQSNLTKKAIENPIFTDETRELRWSVFKNYDAKTSYDIVKDKVFPFIKNLHMGKDTAFAEHMKEAIFMIPKASLLESVIEMISDISMDDRDSKGDLYEYLLSKLTTAGINGQFRTPRHIIKMMTDMMKPTPDDVVCDPACGTAGFLMATDHYLRDQFSSNELFGGDRHQHYHNSLFNGFDFDSSMLRIGCMNLLLHGIDNPNVSYRDSLSSHPEGEIENEYSLIMANPPFKGSVDYDTVSHDLIRALGKTPKKKQSGTANGKKSPTEKTELLFIALMIRMLKTGGRCAVIVPDGVLFGSSNAHKEIRKSIVEGHKLEAVISMPSGVFRPYAGVSTGIMIFTKTNSGGTDKVWFYDMKADGFSLDDKRTELDQSKHEANNIPDVLKRWENINEENNRKKTDQSFMVSKEDIVTEGYDLSINRYKEVVYEEVKYDSPMVIIGRVKELQKSIDERLNKLEGMIV